MKFTKLTSSVLAGATLLSILAPTASFAATSTAGSKPGATQDNGTGANAALPQEGHTIAGISFGDNTPLPNEGYLRLQKVPVFLDFGNHYLLNEDALDFNAKGENVDSLGNAIQKNNKAAGFEGTKENKTVTLNTTDDALKAVAGTTWATVVDKQVTRAKNAKYNKNTTQEAGTWHLDVKSDDQLHAVDENGKPLPTTGTAGASNVVPGAVLSFNNTKYGQTQEVYTLTGEGQDATYEADLAKLSANGGTAPAVEAVKTITAGTEASPLALTLAPTTTGTGTQVAKAAAGEGQGANVFGWMPKDVKLTMPSGFKVNNAIYKANLTWTLTSDAL